MRLLSAVSPTILLGWNQISKFNYIKYIGDISKYRDIVNFIAEIFTELMSQIYINNVRASSLAIQLFDGWISKIQFTTINHGKNITPSKKYVVTITQNVCMINNQYTYPTLAAIEKMLIDALNCNVNVLIM